MRPFNERSIEQRADATLAPVVVTADIVMEHLLVYNTFIKWTKVGGVLSGTAKLRRSNDGINYVDIPTKTQAIADATSQVDFEGTDFACKYLQIHITIATGVADLLAITNAKGV